MNPFRVWSPVLQKFLNDVFVSLDGQPFQCDPMDGELKKCTDGIVQWHLGEKDDNNIPIYEGDIVCWRFAEERTRTVFGQSEAGALFVACRQNRIPQRGNYRVIQEIIGHVHALPENLVIYK
jgi:hypothetical protein